MTATIDEVLHDLRTTATCEADKGDRFERLVKKYLTTDPVFADQFSAVWRWPEWPGNGGRHDETMKVVDALPPLEIRADQLTSRR